MADPTAKVSALNSTTIDTSRVDNIIKNAEALVIQGIAAIDVSTGKLEFADDLKNLVPAGMIISATDGINDHLTGNSGQTYRAITQGNFILRKVSVTGVTAITDTGSLVYMTDGQTFTLTKPVCGVPYGIVVGWYSTTYVDVYLFSFVDAVKMSLMKQPTESKTLFNGLTQALQSTSETILRTFIAKEHFKILSLHCQPTGFDNAVVAGAQTVNVKIGSVATTGGVLSLGYASFDAYTDLGTAIDATTITAANEVHIGDTYTLVMNASGTGFTADAIASLEIYAVVQYLPGA